MSDKIKFTFIAHWVETWNWLLWFSRIVLEPMMEVPVEEAWLFENKEALRKVLTGLAQKGSRKRGSFSKHAK